MPRLNEALALRYNGAAALRAVYNGVTVYSSADYPLVKDAYSSLEWVIYPGLFAKDNLENEFLVQGVVNRTAGGFASAADTNVAYYPPFSPTMAELTNSGEATIVIKVTPDGAPGTGERILLNTARSNALQLDKFRVYFNGNNLLIRNLGAGGEGTDLITKSVNMGFSFQDNVSYMVAVAVNDDETRFYVNGVSVGAVDNTEPNFVFNNSTIAYIGLCHRGPHLAQNSWPYKDLSFAAIFSTALSSTLIENIYENPRILIRN